MDVNRMKINKWSIEHGDYDVEKELSDYKRTSFQKNNFTKVALKAVIFYSAVITIAVISLKLL